MGTTAPYNHIIIYNLDQSPTKNQSWFAPKTLHQRYTIIDFCFVSVVPDISCIRIWEKKQLLTSWYKDLEKIVSDDIFQWTIVVCAHVLYGWQKLMRGGRIGVGPYQKYQSQAINIQPVLIARWELGEPNSSISISIVQVCRAHYGVKIKNTPSPVLFQSGVCTLRTPQYVSIYL